MRMAIFALLILASPVPGLLHAQDTDPDIQALEQRLQKAKAAEAQKQEAKDAAARGAAAKKAESQQKAKAEADRTADERHRTQQADAPQATLVVKADAACQLTINGEAKGALQTDETKVLKVSPGEQLVECASIDHVGARTQETRSVAASAQGVVVLSLAEKIAAQQREERQKDEAAKKAARDTAEAELAAREPRNLGFIDLGNGVLKDTKTGLEWTQSDYGHVTSWNGAERYCATLSSGWRLPSVDELGAIHKSGWVDTRCEGRGSCGVSPLFHVHGTWYFSGTDFEGSVHVWVVRLSNGSRNHTHTGRDFTTAFGVLCIRRP